MVHGARHGRYACTCSGDEVGLDAYAPYSGTIFDLAANAFVLEAQPVPIEHKQTSDAAADLAEKLTEDQKSQKHMAPEYSELLGAAERLIALVRTFRGRKVTQIKKLTKEIHKLADRWEDE